MYKKKLGVRVITASPIPKFTHDVVFPTPPF